MSEPVAVVLWDLDGTILDPAGAITEGIAEALWTCGFEPPENLERFVGPPIGESLRRYTAVPEDRIPEIISVYRAGYLTEGLERTRCYPGIEEQLDRLRGLGVRQAIATQKPEHVARHVVERFGLGDYVETVSGAADDLATPRADSRATQHATEHASEDATEHAAGGPSHHAADRTAAHAVSAPSHPVHEKPEIIAEALRRLGIQRPDPRRTVMIGDRRYDAEGAAAHGLDCLGAGWGFGAPGELEATCVAVAARPADLAHLLDRYLHTREV